MGTLERKKVKYLVVDTSAFIQNAALQNIGENIITVPEVIQEIKSKRQLRKLVVLPYYLSVKDAYADSIRFVSQFSKKTGDYPSLSATDVNVIALTYQLEKEHRGTSHLNEAPVHKPTIEPVRSLPEDLKNVVGFHIPKRLSSKINSVNTSENEDELSEYDSAEEGELSYEKKAYNNISEESSEDINLAVKAIKNVSIRNSNENDCNKENEVVAKREDIEFKESNDEEDNDGDGDDEDDEDWITPDNITNAKNQISSELDEAVENVTVACLTTDFAMQNVLKQIGLQVVSLDGRLIKQLRTFILRCYGCFKTTSIMTKVFCPNCGNKTLKKVGVSLNSDGSLHLHINFKKPLTARGKRFSLPHPKGGKHSNNPILCEDQPMPHQKPSRLSTHKTNALNDDYIAGYSPFVTRDISSKSAMLGIKPHVELKHWMRRNPNENRRKKK